MTVEWNQEASGLPEQVVLHDVTLRDGSQFSGVEFTADEQVEIARRLDSIGMARIEAGRIAIERDRPVIERIAGAGLSARIAGLIKMSVDDARRAADLGVSLVTVAFPAYERSIREKLGMTLDDVVRVAIEMTEVVNDNGLEVVLFPIDGARAGPKALERIVAEVGNACPFHGLTFVDTIGLCGPDDVRAAVRRLSSMTDAPIEVHCHNDFGLATASTLAGLGAGASVAHVSVLGIGERAGNACLEEVVMALDVLFGHTTVQTDRLVELADFVREAGCVSSDDLRPITGRRLFEIESNENVTGFGRLAEAEGAHFTFPYHWDRVGQRPVVLALGADSTLAALGVVLDRLGRGDLDEQSRRLLLQHITDRSLAEKRRLLESEIEEFIQETP